MFPHLRTQLRRELHRGRPPGRHGSIGDHVRQSPHPRRKPPRLHPAKLSKDRGRGRRKPTQRHGHGHPTLHRQGQSRTAIARADSGTHRSGAWSHIFSPTSLLKKGLRCVVEESTPHLTIQGKGDSTHTRSARPRHVHLDITFEQNVSHLARNPSCPTRKQSQTHTANAVCFTLVSADTWHRRLGTSQCSEPGHPSEGHGYRGGLSRQSLPLRGLPDRETQAVPPPEAIDSRTITAWTACGHRQHGAC